MACIGCKPEGKRAGYTDRGADVGAEWRGVKEKDSRGSRSWAMETVPVLLWVGVGQRDSQPRSHHAWGQRGHVLQE